MLPPLLPTIVEIFGKWYIIAAIAFVIVTNFIIQIKVKNWRYRIALDNFLVAALLLFIAVTIKLTTPIELPAPTQYLLLARGNPAVTPSGVTITLTNVISLRGWAEGRDIEFDGGAAFAHGNHRYNITQFSEQEVDRILRRLTTDIAPEQFFAMDQQEFESFMDSLRDDERKSLGAISFAEFEISNNGRVISKIKAMEGDSVSGNINGRGRWEFRVNNVFNTAEKASGSREGAYITIIGQSN